MWLFVTQVPVKRPLLSMNRTRGLLASREEDEQFWKLQEEKAKVRHEQYLKRMAARAAAKEKAKVKAEKAKQEKAVSLSWIGLCRGWHVGTKSRQGREKGPFFPLETWRTNPFIQTRGRSRGGEREK